MKITDVEKVYGNESQLSDQIGNEAFALLAHDIRSSMFGMLGSLEMIETDGLPLETKKRLNRARASGALLNDLLKLVFGGAEEGDNNSPVDVFNEIELLVQRWHDETEAAKISVNIDLPMDIHRLGKIDRVGFHRVFNNLLGNAVKFAKGGEISIKAENASDKVIISISDNGAGFSDDALEMLFAFGGRPKDSTEEGSGLGLYISYGIVTDAGGAISVKNNEAAGACVTITLPTEMSETAEAISNASNELPDLSHMNILLAEDNVTNQLVVTQMLKSMGATFQIASDGVEAINIFNTEPFDVVLLDIEMPRKSGLEVLREIRSREDERSATPLIALTAYVMQEHRDRIAAAGADGVIAKPILGIADLGRQILKLVHGATGDGNIINASGSDETDVDAGFLDRAIYDQLLKTIGKDFRSEFLGKVILDFENIKKGLVDAEVAGSFAELRSNSHILISVSGAIGATNLQKLAQELNRAAHDGSMQNANPLNSKCIKGISSILDFLNKEIS